MIRWMLLAALAATPAMAQDTPDTPPSRIRNVILYGDQECPKADSPDEIVVCANGGDSPYRIPPRFRESAQTPANRSWANRVEMIEEVNRAGLPGSCSPIGTGGQTGCSRAFIQRWAQEKLDAEAKGARVP